MTTSLYSTPFKSSAANFAPDTQSEMDNIDVTKRFHAGATISSVLPRMSLIDSLNEAHASRVTGGLNQEPEEYCSHLGWKINSKDIPFIVRTSLSLRRNAIQQDISIIPNNMYSKDYVISKNFGCKVK